MTIGTVCTRQVVTCSADVSVLQVAKLMLNEQVGDIVVVEERGDGQVPVGIVTDRDLVIKVMAAAGDPAVVTAGDVMSGKLVVAYEGEELDVAMGRMNHDGVRRVPVVDSAGALVGIVTLDDIVAKQPSSLRGATQVA